MRFAASALLLLPLAGALVLPNYRPAVMTHHRGEHSPRSGPPPSLGLFDEMLRKMDPQDTMGQQTEEARVARAEEQAKKKAQGGDGFKMPAMPKVKGGGDALKLPDMPKLPNPFGGD